MNKVSSEQKISLIAGMAVVVVAVALAWVGMEKGGAQYGPAEVGQSLEHATSTYSMAEVALRKDVSGCWSVIDGDVYDLTGWISQHPGGDLAILSLCGKDGSAAFRGVHNDAQKQRDVLATMRIGTLR